MRNLLYVSFKVAGNVRSVNVTSMAVILTPLVEQMLRLSGLSIAASVNSDSRQISDGHFKFKNHC